MIPANFGTLNVYTLTNNIQTDILKRRTALVDRKLVRCSIDTAALSETCLVEEEQLKAGYISFWSGYAKKASMKLELALQSRIIW